MQVIRDQRLFDLMVNHFELMVQLDNEDIQDYLAGAAEIEEGKALVWKDEEGFFHRDGDKPAIIDADGTKAWLVNGEPHRDGDKPAGMWANGTKTWWVNGKKHRDGDQPAIIRANGHREWWVNNKLHRDNDQPAIIWANGDQEWWVKGERVR